MTPHQQPQQPRGLDRAAQLEVFEDAERQGITEFQVLALVRRSERLLLVDYQGTETWTLPVTWLTPDESIPDALNWLCCTHIGLDRWDASFATTAICSLPRDGEVLQLAFDVTIPPTTKPSWCLPGRCYWWDTNTEAPYSTTWPGPFSKCSTASDRRTEQDRVCAEPADSVDEELAEGRPGDELAAHHARLLGSLWVVSRLLVYSAMVTVAEQRTGSLFEECVMQLPRLRMKELGVEFPKLSGTLKFPRDGLELLRIALGIVADVPGERDWTSWRPEPVCRGQRFGPRIDLAAGTAKTRFQCSDSDSFRNAQQCLSSAVTRDAHAASGTCRLVRQITFVEGLKGRHCDGSALRHCQGWACSCWSQAFSHSRQCLKCPTSFLYLTRLHVDARAYPKCHSL